jgi:hypothetical protein
MDHTPVIDILESQYRKEDDASVNRWYNEIHMPILMKSDKVKSISIYKAMGDSSDFVRYFIICKYASQKDFESFLASQEFEDAGKDSLDSQTLKTNRPVHCEMVREWIQ